VVATLADGENVGVCGDGGGGIGFTWQAPRAGAYLFSTRGGAADTVLSLREGGCDGAELSCNDDSGSAASALSATLTAGQNVGLELASNPASRGGDFVLNVRAVRCPDADLGARMGQGVVSGTTFGGVDDSAAACGGEGSEDVAFAFRAPADGVYRFSLFEPRYQAVLYLREGSCGGVELGCSPAPDVGPVEVMLAADEQVIVVVDGRDGASGDFQLDVFARDARCDASCGGMAASGTCACDAACVAGGDCCIDACQSCGHCRCQRACTGRACGDDGCGGRCGECGPGLRCDDRARCVDDPCAGVVCAPSSQCEGGRCQPLPEGEPCEDGDLCTVRDRCVRGECAGEARDCDDGVACTDDRCVTSTGACESRTSDECERCDGGLGCPLGLLDAGSLPADAATDGDGSVAVSGRESGCGCRVGKGRGPLLPALWVASLLLLWRRRSQRTWAPGVAVHEKSQFEDLPGAHGSASFSRGIGVASAVSRSR
jgi:hypothetical protein